jgi:oligopeptide transport system substrate-binding protein
MIKLLFKKILLLTFFSLFFNFSFNTKANTITVALLDDPISLDPQYVSGMWEYRLLINMFEGLVTIDNKGNIAPGVAESWTISKDGKTYTFKLRKSNWSDGTPVTAKNFEFAIKRILNPQTAAPYSSLLYDIKGAEYFNSGKGKESDVMVKAIDDNTLQIELKEPTAFFMEILSHPSLYPLPMHIVNKHGKDWVKQDNIVFNGAYKIIKYIPKSSIEAVRNTKYYNNKETKIEKILFLTTSDSNSILEAFRAGQVDFSYDFPSQRIDWVKQNLAEQAHIYPISALFYLSLNIREDSKSPFKDIRVRRALALAIDREFLVEKVLKTGSVPSYAYVPKGLYKNTGKSPELDFVNLTKEQRLEEAKRLLAEAGYGPKKPLKFEFAYNSNDENKLIAVALASMLKPLNIEFNQTVAESNVHYGNLQVGKFELGRARWIADYQDPFTFLYLFQKGVSYNYAGYNNPEYDKLLEKAKSVINFKERFTIYKQAETIILKDIPTIPLFYLVDKLLVSKKVLNFTPNINSVYKFQYLDIAK